MWPYSHIHKEKFPSIAKSDADSSFLWALKEAIICKARLDSNFLGEAVAGMVKSSVDLWQGNVFLDTTTFHRPPLI